MHSEKKAEGVEKRMEDQNQKKDTRVEVEFDGPIESKPFDITPFIGKKALIASAETHYNERYDSYYLLLKSEPVAYVNDDPEKPVTASKIYSLMSQDGKFGWRKDGDLDVFLRSHGVASPSGLVGKEVVMVPSKPRKEDGVRFLTFG